MDLVAALLPCALCGNKSGTSTPWKNPEPKNLDRINRINKIKSKTIFNYESSELLEYDPNPVNPVNPVKNLPGCSSVLSVSSVVKNPELLHHGKPQPKNLDRINRIYRIQSKSIFNYESPKLLESAPNPVNPE
jgi:hypothetical protein